MQLSSFARPLTATDSLNGIKKIYHRSYYNSLHLSWRVLVYPSTGCLSSQSTQQFSDSFCLREIDRSIRYSSVSSFGSQIYLFEVELNQYIFPRFWISSNLKEKVHKLLVSGHSCNKRLAKRTDITMMNGCFRKIQGQKKKKIHKNRTYPIIS